MFARLSGLLGWLLLELLTRSLARIPGMFFLGFLEGS